MSDTTILAITSNTELIIYDFIQNQQIKYLSSSFKCFLFANFSSDIYCLENNGILKKFDYTSLDFIIISDQIIIQIEVSEFYALSQQVLAFISLQGQIIILNLETQQALPLITSFQQVDKIQQIEQYIIILTQQQYLQVYQMQNQINTLNLVQAFQYNRKGYEILDFLVITFNNKNTLIIAESVTIYAYNLQSNSLIGNLPTACQKSLQLKQDDNYLYVICSFQITIFDKIILKLINYQKINQFKYSNIRNVQHLYQDFFAFILYDDLILVKLNSYSSQIVESFTKLDNPQIYQVNLIYQNQQQVAPTQIQLRCFSDSNLFDITHEMLNSSYQTSDTLINFVQSPSIYNNNYQHKNFQDRVSTQQLNLKKYVIQMSIQYSKLEQIQKFYEVFTLETLIEYQFNIQKDKLNMKGIANLTDSSFILKEFYILSFDTIILQININDTNFILNQFGNLKTLQFFNTDFVFDKNSKSYFLISNLNTLILDSININDQEIYESSNIKMTNVTNILISNLSIKNIKILSERSLFSFQNVTNITFTNLNLIDSETAAIFFEFIDCQTIYFQNLNIQKLTINKGNLFQIIKSNIVQISNLNATQIKTISLPQRILNFIPQEKQRILQDEVQQSQTSSLLNFLGCYKIYLSDLQFDRLNDITVLVSNHYAASDQLQYFSKQISMKKIILKEIEFSFQKNLIFNITSLQGQLNYINFTNINSLNNLVILNIQNKMNISNSVFTNANLIEGSVISLKQGQLNLTRSSFINITCQGSPCALNIESSDLIQINNNNFTNLNNTQLQISSTKITSYFQGGAIIISSSKQTFIENCQFQNCISQNEAGAIIILNSKQTLIDKCQFQNCISQKQGGALIISSSQQTLIENCQFQNCISQKEGGAIYSSQQNQENITIFRSDFLENQSSEGSGGAIFLSQINQINITQSNFQKNIALKQNGGAISLVSSNLSQFSENTFSYNEARIGGSIYYDKINSDLVNTTNLLLNAIIFQFNKASFYGQNIGSIPKYIGITNQPYLESLKIVQEYSIDNIASGNYLNQKLYLNFIDEEKKPFKFAGLDTQSYQIQFYFQLKLLDNSSIAIQQGNNINLNETIGMFEMYFQSVYKESQNQSINIISNQFEQNVSLSILLNLNYRNCIVGEIIQESNKFIECNQCVEGRYSLNIPDMQKDINKLQCISCPEQAKSCRGSELILKDGYWRESNLTDQIYTCLLESCAFDNPLSKSGCLTGYIGPLCNSCDSKQSVWGRQYGLKNKKCYPCSQEFSQILYLCFFILFYVFYITISQQKIINSKIKKIKLNIFKQIGLLITSNLSSSGNDISLLYKIFMNYLQILSYSSNFGILSQQFVSTSLNIFGDPITMTVTTFDCLFKMSDKYPLWFNRIVTQLFTILIICLLALFQQFISLLLSYKKREQAYKQFATTMNTTFIFFYIFYQPSISKMLIQSLICIKIGSKYYLTADYSQECYDYYHLLYALIVVVPLIILFCFIIPYFLFKKLKYLQKKDSQNRLIYSRVVSIMTYGFLYTGYKSKFLYWEIIKIINKFILTILINIVIQDNIKLMLIICLLQIYYLYHLKSQPYQNQNICQQEKLLIQKLIFTFLMLSAIINDDTDTRYLTKICQIIIFFINISSIQIVLIARFGEINLEKDQKNIFIYKIKILLQKMQKKYPNFLRFIRIRQIKVIRVHFLWKKVIERFRSKMFKLIKAEVSITEKSLKNNNLEEISRIQNFKSPEILSFIPSKNAIFKQINFQNDRITQSSNQFSSQKFNIVENSKQNQVNFNNKSETQQLENSTDSGVIFENEFSSVQLGQNFIFNKIIAANKFQQTKLDEKNDFK
ncbi:hypothetical protein ABPG72_010709 [Tetrahymena utriculariae]